MSVHARRTKLRGLFRGRSITPVIVLGGVHDA